MDAAKMVMAGKEDFDRDNEKHNAFNNNFEEEKLWFVDDSSSESDITEQSDSSSDNRKLVKVNCKH